MDKTRDLNKANNAYDRGYARKSLESEDSHQNRRGETTHPRQLTNTILLIAALIASGLLLLWTYDAGGLLPLFIFLPPIIYLCIRRPRPDQNARGHYLTEQSSKN